MSAKQIATGGVSGALAVVILCLGGSVPFATYVLSVICCILLQMILPVISKKGGWTWYCCVSILAVLLCPDKEAAATIVFLGWYPLVKPGLDRKPWAVAAKVLLFNFFVIIMYGTLIYLLGFKWILADFQALGGWITVIVLVMGNVCFLMLDIVLSRLASIVKK